MTRGPSRQRRTRARGAIPEGAAPQRDLARSASARNYSRDEISREENLLLQFCFVFVLRAARVIRAAQGENRRVSARRDSRRLRNLRVPALRRFEAGVEGVGDRDQKRADTKADRETNVGNNAL